jgi:hypothetical protein
VHLGRQRNQLVNQILYSAEHNPNNPPVEPQVVYLAHRAWEDFNMESQRAHLDKSVVPELQLEDFLVVWLVVWLSQLLQLEASSEPHQVVKQEEVFLEPQLNKNLLGEHLQHLMEVASLVHLLQEQLKQHRARCLERVNLPRELLERQ